MELSLSFMTIFLSIVCGVIVSVQSITFEQDVTLTDNQKQALDKFKRRILPKVKFPHKYMSEELNLIKWLRDSGFNLEKAEKRIVNDLEWRRVNKMDTIHSEDFSEFTSEFPYYLDGRDKYGRSFLFLEVKGLDLRKALIQGKTERLNRYADKAVDEACNLVRELGEKYKNITRGHLIINLDGFNLIQHSCLPCVPFLLRIVIQYQEHYPECADQIIVVNAPGIVEPLLNTIKPLLNNELRESLRVYGTNKQQWIKAMSKDFDLDKLPPSLGGTQIYHGMEEEFNY